MQQSSQPPVERLKSRTKSLMYEARKSIANDKFKAEPIDPVLAAGGLAPSPAAARTKIAMLPTASNLAEGEAPLPSIFSSINASGTPFGEPLGHPPGGAPFGRRSTSVSLSPIAQHGTHAPRSASALDEPSWLSGGGNDGVSHGAFSNHPKYKEHTVEDYHRVMDDFQKIKWGGLGADDSAETRKARETRQRVLNYGKCVSQLNVQLIKNHQQAVSPQRTTDGTAIARKLTLEGELAKLKRERALKFADQLWMKERKTRSPPPVREDHHASVQRSSNVPSQSTIVELKQLEDRHRSDYEKILAIKKQLGIVVPSDGGGGREGASSTSFPGDKEDVEDAEGVPSAAGGRPQDEERTPTCEQDDVLPAFLHEEDYVHAQREEAHHTISPANDEAPLPCAIVPQPSIGAVPRLASVRSRHSTSSYQGSDEQVQAAVDGSEVAEHNASIVAEQQPTEDVCDASHSNEHDAPAVASPDQSQSSIHATGDEAPGASADDEPRGSGLHGSSNEGRESARLSGGQSQQSDDDGLLGDVSATGERLNKSSDNINEAAEHSA